VDEESSKLFMTHATKHVVPIMRTICAIADALKLQPGFDKRAFDRRLRLLARKYEADGQSDAAFFIRIAAGQRNVPKPKV
jgi:hypothetical protein